MVPHDPGTNAEPANACVPRGVVTVVGGAVSDHIYRVDHVPSAGPEAHGRFEAHPGGKGLNRAVAAARLGLRSRLISAVGDDDAGGRILAYLRAERVNTEHVRVVPGVPSAITMVVVNPTGVSTTIGCREDGIVPDVEHIGDGLAAADVVLLTFEQPSWVIDRVLAAVRSLRPAPVLIVHAAPPIEAPHDLLRHLDRIDYLIGAPWELGDLAGTRDADFDSSVAPWLRARGVRSVCAVEHLACRVRSDTVNLDLPANPAARQGDSPGGGAAFGAALAYRLLLTERPATGPDYYWATAAMASTSVEGPVPVGMPTSATIDAVVARYPASR
ncbi:PfkB family carbohydrate kinase [Nocardia sp. NPDC050412]|uniref:PfkB family carbohydrate kinase n=1 Tax=Nocardia sp. NPDC050412 TaxID=3364320 RepID=UPI0037B6BDDE